MNKVFILLLFISLAQAQPTPPTVSYPLSLSRGGSQLNNTMTTVSTSGTINNYSFPTQKLKFTGSAVTLTGLVSDATAKEVLIYNATGSDLTIAHESGSSTAANRITCLDSSNYSLPRNQGVKLFYDTVSSRWRFSHQGIKVSSPLSKNSDSVISMPAATGSQSGYLSSTDFSIFTSGIVWGTSGTNIYNTNSDAVWISKYPCSALVTQATCAAQTGCTVVNGSNCSDFNGDEATCNATLGCSYSDPDCSGSYFSACTGFYRADDGTGSKVQVKATETCSGTPATCVSLGAGANCTEQVGCTSNPNTCPGIGDQGTCDGTSGCAWFECSAYNGDQTSCEADSNCSWSDPDCNGAYCGGDSSSCSGTAAACSGLDPCANQDGCANGLTPAIRAQGDNITTTDGYLEFEKTSAGAPTAGDCDNDNERGRFQLDTTNNRLYICNGATRGWDYSDLTD